MIRFGFLRRWNGTLLAVLLALAVLMPTVDNFICIADTEQTLSATVEMVADIEKSMSSQQQHDDGDASCIHGHCHHWVGFAKAGERTSFRMTAMSLAPPPVAGTAPPSAPPNELLRPPQA